MRKIRIEIIVLFILTMFYMQGTAQQRPMLVSIAKVGQSDISTNKEYIGTVKYYAITTVSAEQSGRVDIVSIDEGSQVAADEVMGALNANMLKLSISAAKARVAQQRAILQQNQRTYTRSTALFSENAISEQSHQDSSTDLQIQTQLYNVAYYEAKKLEEELNKSSFRAPFDGIVLKRYVNVGSWVNTGSPVFDIASKRMEVEINLPQSAIKLVSQAEDVHVKINEKVYDAKVRAIVPNGNANLRTFPVKIAIAYDPSFMNGMDCIVFIPTNVKSDVLSVPRDAIVTKDKENYVYLVQDGIAKSMPVRVMGYSGKYAGIQSPNVNVGMQVITRGNENIVSGQPVQIAD